MTNQPNLNTRRALYIAKKYISDEDMISYHKDICNGCIHHRVNTLSRCINCDDGDKFEGEL